MGRGAATHHITWSCLCPSDVRTACWCLSVCVYPSSSCAVYKVTKNFSLQCQHFFTQTGVDKRENYGHVFSGFFQGRGCPIRQNRPWWQRWEQRRCGHSSTSARHVHLLCLLAFCCWSVRCSGQKQWLSRYRVKDSLSNGMV